MVYGMQMFWVHDFFDFCTSPRFKVSLCEMYGMSENKRCSEKDVSSGASWHVGGVIAESLLPVEDQSGRAEGLPTVLGAHPACAEAILAGTIGNVATFRRTHDSTAGIVA